MLRFQIARFEACSLARFCFTVLIALLLGSKPDVVWGQADTLNLVVVLNGLSEGDADILAAHAEDYLELALLEQPRRYTRSQALYVLREFFREYAPAGFELDRSMTQGEEWWLTGRYTVRDGDHVLRFYLRFGGSYPAYRLMAIQVIRS